MGKIITLTESQLTNMIKRIVQESKSSPSKKEILGMSKDELKDVYGDLEVKGEYHGKKGVFHHFKKTSLGDVVCSFRTDDPTPSGLKRNTQAVKVKMDNVKFKNNINESEEEDNEVTPEIIIGMLMRSAESISQEDYDDPYDWMQDVFSPVENELEDMGMDISDLRMEYDDILLSMWEQDDDDWDDED